MENGCKSTISPRKAVPLVIDLATPTRKQSCVAVCCRHSCRILSYAKSFVNFSFLRISSLSTDASVNSVRFTPNMASLLEFAHVLFAFPDYESNCICSEETVWSCSRMMLDESCKPSFWVLYSHSYGGRDDANVWIVGNISAQIN